MQIENPRPEERTSFVPLELPEGAEIQQVAFVTGADPTQKTLMEFKEPRSCRAILVTDDMARPDIGVTMLLVPTNDPEDPDLMTNVWSWVEPKILQEHRRGMMIMLWGARVIWTPGRAGIMVSADRLEAVRRAIIDFSFYDEEIRKIEAEVARMWPHLEADTPLAFQFEGQDLPKRKQLAERFQQVMDLRRRLVRIDPVVHPLTVHPGTLASQLNERLKERTQLSERMEFIDEQLELLEKVYAMCADRSSERAIAQYDARLSWMITILLAMETIALLVDLLTANWI